MATFPQYREEDVTMGMTGAQGWVLYAWAVEHEARVWGGRMKRTTPGYVAQERDRILANGKK